MTFLAQYRFKESYDIIGELPGDVLLMFVEDVVAALGRPSYFHFEWYPLGLDELVAPAEVPAASWAFLNCYGVRFRTIDYIDDAKAEPPFRQLLGEIGPERPGFCNERVMTLTRLLGMKIGGAPLWLEPDDPEIPRDAGRLLCTLADIVPRWDVSFPWLNHPTPLAIGEVTGSNWLYWRDGGCFYFFVDDFGRLSWHLQFF